MEPSPDDQENFEKAVQLVHRHCQPIKYPDELLIAPIIIGVGDQVAEASLNRFAEKFTGQPIIIDGDASYQQNLFRELFDFMHDDVKRIPDDLKGLYERLSTTTIRQTKLINEELKKRKRRSL